MDEEQSTENQMEHVSLPSKIRSTLAICFFFSLSYNILLVLSSFVFWFVSIIVLLNLAILWMTYRTGKKKRRLDQTFMDDIKQLNGIRELYWIDAIILSILSIAFVFSPSLDTILIVILVSVPFSVFHNMDDLGKALVIWRYWKQK